MEEAHARRDVKLRELLLVSSRARPCETGVERARGERGARRRQGLTGNRRNFDGQREHNGELRLDPRRVRRGAASLRTSVVRGVPAMSAEARAASRDASLPAPPVLAGGGRARAPVGRVRGGQASAASADAPRRRAGGGSSEAGAGARRHARAGVRPRPARPCKPNGLRSGLARLAVLAWRSPRSGGQKVIARQVRASARSWRRGGRTRTAGGAEQGAGASARRE